MGKEPQEMKGLLIAIQFLTIIPVRGNFQMRDFSGATIFFPLIGLLIGSILGLLYFVTSFYFTSFTASAVIVVGEIVLTSGLHLDGFIDTIDALASGKDREATLAIFRDIHTGAKSVLAVFALLLGKFVLVAEFHPPIIYPLLLTMPVIGRWIQVGAMALFPYAREAGLGTGFINNIGPWHLLAATLFTLVATGCLLGIPGLTGMVLIGIMAYGCAVLLSRRLGGLVGDIYGAFGEVGEVFLLLLMAVFIRL